MPKNKLIISAAGSGKTTFLVEEAAKVRDEWVLITTYTEANAEEIKAKFAGKTPANVTVQTWFSFLLEHGARPFQSEMNDAIHEARIGFLLTSERSGLRGKINGRPIFWGEKDFFKFYFAKDLRIYSDKVSKFIVECNKRTHGAVIARMANVFPYIFVDEVQDLAGWDLELLKLLFESSSKILLVGDPRQVTYLTNPGAKYKQYRDGRIKRFVERECNKKTIICDIDEETLSVSHRNHAFICQFSSSLFPEYERCTPCTCAKCRNNLVEHRGVFVVKPSDVAEYCAMYRPQVLRYDRSVSPEMNYGVAKGLTFDRVLIYPTVKICEYLRTGDLGDMDSIRSKFYVAVTRAKHSAAIILDYEKDARLIDGVLPWPSRIEL